MPLIKGQSELQDMRLTVMAQSATQGETSFNVEGYRDYRGVPVIGAWRWIDDLDMGITSEIDVAEAYGVYQLASYSVWSLCVGASVLVVALMGSMRRRQKWWLNLATNSNVALKSYA